MDKIYTCYGVIGVVCACLIMWFSLGGRPTYLLPPIILLATADAIFGVLAGDRRVYRFVAWLINAVMFSTILVYRLVNN